jgi:hypothetical protein
MSRTCGPQDIISLVIPKVGDNRPIFLAKRKTHHKLKITATFWWATTKFPRSIVYMILPLTR